jgi:mono/diheme cytochrome c family protein
MTAQRTRHRTRWLPTTADVLVVVAIVAGLGTRPLSAAPQDGTAERSTIAGVYTNDQADRGHALFDARCQSCHGAALEGGTLAPALRGSEFLAPFLRKPLRRIYSRIISTMPPDDAGSLSETETLALVAFVLRSNGYPAGSVTLARADDLNSIDVAPMPEKRDRSTWTVVHAEHGRRHTSLPAVRAVRSRSGG